MAGTPNRKEIKEASETIRVLANELFALTEEFQDKHSIPTPLFCMLLESTAQINWSAALELPKRA